MAGKRSWVPPWCSHSKSCSIMPWAVWTECVISSEVLWSWHELYVPPVYSRTDQSYQIQSETPMVQQGSQLSERTEGLRIPEMLWQWPQGLQLSEWTEGLRNSVMLWQWPQGLQLSEWTEGSKVSAMLWQWPKGLQLSECTEGWRTLTMLWQWSQSLHLSEWTEGLRTPAMLWQWQQGLQLSGWTEVFLGTPANTMAIAVSSSRVNL